MEFWQYSRQTFLITKFVKIYKQKARPPSRFCWFKSTTSLVHAPLHEVNFTRQNISPYFTFILFWWHTLWINPLWYGFGIIQPFQDFKPINIMLKAIVLFCGHCGKHSDNSLWALTGKFEQISMIFQRTINLKNVWGGPQKQGGRWWETRIFL